MLNQEIPEVISRLLTTQQAFPKSAILTLILSAFIGSRGLTSRDPAVSLPTVDKGKETKRHEWTKKSNKSLIINFQSLADLPFLRLSSVLY